MPLPYSCGNGIAGSVSDRQKKLVSDQLPTAEYALTAQQLNVYYGSFHAVADVDLEVPAHKVTAMIGPSGCGKSTILRAFNRMNDLVDTARSTGAVRFRGKNIYDADVDPVEVRRAIGMVFQKPNPFPKSVYDNVAWGARIHKYQGDMDELVEGALKRVALWDEVKDKLSQSGLALSGGQQQRLCIARAVAVQPDVILMDEPASALDPIATLHIEELMRELAEFYTIVVVTHNMQQAGRVSDLTAFFSVRPGTRTGELVEFGTTDDIFNRPKDARTNDYITGRFG